MSIWQIQARKESQGPEGGVQSKQRLIRAVCNRFGLDDSHAKEAIEWVQGS
jgi:hypothetical protein